MLNPSKSDLSSDSESDEDDFRINRIIMKTLRPGSQMFLLPEVSKSDMQLLAEARDIYKFVCDYTPKLFHRVLRSIYR